MFCLIYNLKMAARRIDSKLPPDSKELDAEFEKFMNEPLSDDSHRTASPMYHQIRGRLERSFTQDSLEKVLADELSTTVTASDSLPPAKLNDNINKFREDREEHIDERDNKKESPLTTAVPKTDRIDQQRESYLTETADSGARIRISRDDTLQDSRVFPGHSFDGMDTLEELADKEQFFHNLAADVSGTLDFGKLNRALDEIQSDNEKSDDLVTVLGINNANQQEGTTLPEVVKPHEDAELEVGAQAAVTNRLNPGHHQDKSMINEHFDEEFQHGIVHTSSDKDIPDKTAGELQKSSAADYDSDTPPLDSLRSIKEVAKARLKEAKQKNKETGRSVGDEKIPGSKERKSSLSRLPRPLEESRRKWSRSKEVQRRRSSSYRSASPYSTYQDSADSSARSSKHDYEPHKSIEPSLETRFQFSEDFTASRASHGAERRSKSNLVYSSEREIPAQRTKDISRELQLQSELYELRADYNKVLHENEKIGKELKRLSKSRNENEMRLKYESQLEQLIQKNSALEMQLKKARELRVRKESDDDELEKEVFKETLQLKKELQEQELLLNGYQLENERLFKEMKRKDSERKELQSTLVEENQRLRNSLAESEKRREYLDIQLQELRKEKEKSDSWKQSKSDDLGIKDSMNRLLAENDSLQHEVISLKKNVDTNERVIKDLDRQNKEMEAIIKKRYPDNIPTLLTGQDAVHNLNMKSSVSPLKVDKNVQVSIDKGPPYNSKHVEFLERTIRRLEKELDSKDEETSRLLAASQLRYKEMSSVYEGHIDGLQIKLDSAMRKQKSLEEAKTTIRGDFDRRNIAKNNELDEAILAEDASSMTKRRRIKRMLEEKEKLRTVEIDENIELQRPVADRASSPIFPAPVDFDLSRLQRENIDLTLKLDRLRVDYEELRVKHATELTKSDAKCDSIRSHAAAEIEEMRKTQIREAEMAKQKHVKLEQALSKLQDENEHLVKRVSDYDFMNEKLKERKLEAAVDKELLQAAKLKEDVLNNQVKLLQKQLQDAIDCQPLPHQRMNHIEMQIAAIQQRQVDREDELQKVMKTTHSKYSSGVNSFGVDWSTIVEAKDAQIKQFREELDEILHTLHSLYASNSFFYAENGNIVPYANAR